MPESCVDCGATHENDHTYEQCVERLVAQRNIAFDLLRQWVARGFPMGGSGVWDATNIFLETMSPIRQDGRAKE